MLAGHLGDATAVLASLDDPAPEVRAAAIGAARRVGVVDDALLAAALGDDSAAVRRRAALVAATCDLAMDRLGDLLDDPDTGVIEVAAFACGERSDVTHSVVRRLLELSGHHDDALVRESAIAAVGSLGGLGAIDRLGLHDDAVEAVLRAATDRASVRRRAVIASAAFDDDRIDEMVATLLDDRDLQVRQIAEDLTTDEPGSDRSRTNGPTAVDPSDPSKPSLSDGSP